MNNPLVLYRVSEPNEMDIAPYKSICIVRQDLDNITYFGQIQKDNDKSKWHKLECNNLEDALKYLENL